MSGSAARGPAVSHALHDADPIAEDKCGIQHHASAGPAAERSLDVLVVELRRAKGRDGWGGIRRREAVRDEMHGEKAECGCISGERALVSGCETRTWRE